MNVVVRERKFSVWDQERIRGSVGKLGCWKPKIFLSPAFTYRTLAISILLSLQILVCSSISKC